MTSPAMTAETVELLQTLIRNGCVNDGTPSSGFEHRNADMLHAFLGDAGLDVERFEPTPGRASLVARIEGTDPTAPSLCLMGHTDVVPVNPEGWTRDPFGGELSGRRRGVGSRRDRHAQPHGVDGGRLPPARHARVPAARRPHLLRRRRRGGGQRARRAVDGRPRARRDPGRLRAHRERRAALAGRARRRYVGVNVGEKGVAWRRLRVRGTPGHGSMPFRSDNALVKAAAVVQRLAEYRPAPRFHELWRERVETLGVDDELAAMLLDPRADRRGARCAAELGRGGSPPRLHAHHVLAERQPRRREDERDPRLRRHRGRHPHAARRDGSDEVQAHLETALGDLADQVEVEILMNDPATHQPPSTRRLWDSLQRAVARPFPTARLTPQFIVGFTDARIFRQMGAVAYGAGAVQPDGRPGGVRSTLPRQRRAGRRRVAGPHRQPLARRRTRPPRLSVLG